MTDKIHKSLYALEIPVFSNSKPDFQKQQGYDILSLKFNAQDTAEIPEAKNILKSLLPRITAPLMINGANNDNIDRELLPELMSVLDRECIISPANENTYKDIVPAVIKGGHRLVLKSPIDINLCKELNILASDMGLPLDKIIIDTDIGGLGTPIASLASLISMKLYFRRSEGRNGMYMLVFLAMNAALLAALGMLAWLIS